MVDSLVYKFCLWNTYVFSPIIGAQAFVNYNSGVVSRGTLIENLEPGCHWLTLTSKDSPSCTDSVYVCVECCTPTNDTINATTCDENQVGTVVDSFVTANGCDSIVTTVTTLVPEVTNTVNLTTCIAGEEGTTVDTFTSAAGCDSIVTTITTLLPTATSTVDATTCDPQQVELQLTPS
ncbi:MAG: hypothetical protein R2728_06630 [Chitinophagales bacterium]